MAVGDLKTEEGIKSLDAFLADHSYVEGWVTGSIVWQHVSVGWLIPIFILKQLEG